MSPWLSRLDRKFVQKYGSESIFRKGHKRMEYMGEELLCFMASNFLCVGCHGFQRPHTGLRKEDLKIDLVDQNTLRISGERRKEEEKKMDQWHRVERSSKRFTRQFWLPENVNVNGISKKLENRVLTVNAPKTQADAANGDNAKRIDIGSA